VVWKESCSLLRRSEGRENCPTAGGKLKLDKFADETNWTLYVSKSDLNRFLVECLCPCLYSWSSILTFPSQFPGFGNTRTAKCSELPIIQFLCLCPVSLSVKLNLIISTTVYNCYIHYPKGSAPFGQHQESRLLARVFWARAENSFRFLSQSDLLDDLLHLTLSMRRVTRGSW